MITEEDKMIYILTVPHLRNWPAEFWVKMWNKYTEWLELNTETQGEIIKDFSFLDWYEFHRDYCSSQFLAEILRR
jgi:hypothetical protein